MIRTSNGRVATATALVLVAGAFGALVACAESEDTPPVDPSNVTGADASGATLPEAAPPSTSEDAGAPDADADGPQDAETDGPPRICSDDNFCHSVLPGKHVLKGVWGDGEGIVWAVSAGGSVLRWDGDAWSEHTSGLSELARIWGSGPTDIWLVATDGTVYRGTGASSSAVAFSAVTLPGDATVPIKCIWGTGPDDIWAVGGKQPMGWLDWPYPATGRAVHYTGADAGWVVDEELSARAMAYENVWGSPSSGLWLEGTVEADSAGVVTAPVIRRAPGSSTWVQFDLPPDPQADFAPKAQTIGAVAVLPGNQIWAVGRTYERAAFWRGTSGDEGQTFDWTFLGQLAWEPQVNALWGTAPNDLWAVGQPGRVTHWNGSKWQQAAIRVTNTPVTTAFYGIWGTSSDDFWVVGDNAALHKTTGTKP